MGRLICCRTVTRLPLICSAHYRTGMARYRQHTAQPVPGRCHNRLHKQEPESDRLRTGNLIAVTVALPPPLLATEKELSDFLKSVEKRAFKRSFYHVRDEEAALDIVQDSPMYSALI
eukprot:Opistho-2@79773